MSQAAFRNVVDFAKMGVPTERVSLLPVTMQSLSMDLLDPHPHEPAQRVQDSAVKELALQILASGVIVPPAVVLRRGRYIIADGNRRVRVARSLGYQSLECCIFDKADIDILFAHLNAGTRSMKSKEWLSFVASVPRANWPKLLERAPRTFAANFQRLVKIMGADYAIALGEAGKIGPNIVVGYADRLVKIAATMNITLSIKAVIVWIVDQNMQNELNILFRAMKHNGNAFTPRKIRSIRACIAQHRPFLGRG